MVSIQNGTIEDFFDSALQTAKQIDQSIQVTPKHTIWMETDDLELLSKYQLIDILREPNAGHGIRKVIKPLYFNEQIEFRAIV